MRALARLDGRIDVLVNNAGVFEPIAVEADADAWRAAWTRTLQINLQASADLSRRADPALAGSQGRLAAASSTSPAARPIAATARRTGTMRRRRPG